MQASTPFVATLAAVTLCGLMGSIQTNAAALPEFQAASLPATAGVGATSIATGDFNKDGLMDIAAVAFGSNQVYWIEQTPAEDGSTDQLYPLYPDFSKTLVDTSTAGPYAIVAIDMDKDNYLDLVVSFTGSATVAWYKWNSGSKTFGAKTVIDASVTDPTSLEVADVDGDLEMDVVVGSASVNQFSYYTRKGQSAWTKVVIDAEAEGEGGLYAVAAGKIDEGDSIDIVTASVMTSKLLWYSNDADGSTFTKHIIDENVADAKGIALVDLDKDDVNDILVASAGGNLSWYKNNNDLTFSKIVIDDQADGVRSVFGADMDGDGDIDVVTANDIARSVIWYEKNGANAFISHTIATEVEGATSVLVENINTDGNSQNYKDVVFAGSQAVVWGVACHTCSSAPPSGAGFGSECNSLIGDQTCTQRCLAGYTDSNGASAGQTYGCKTDGTLTYFDKVLACIPDDCTQTGSVRNVPVGTGYDAAGCNDFVTDSTCTHRCNAGYYDNNAEQGMPYTCPAGVFTGAKLQCAPSPCTAKVPKGDEYDSGCNSLVTDSACKQTCMPGYSASSDHSAAGEVYTCVAGVFTVTLPAVSPLKCIPDDCTASVPIGDGYTSSVCDALVSGGTCTHTCVSGFADKLAPDGRGYSCPNGVFTGTPLVCRPELCIDEIPTGPAYSAECNLLRTDGTCQQRCQQGYADNNGGKGQPYACPGGAFAAPEPLVCNANVCTARVPAGDGFRESSCSGLVTAGVCKHSCADGYEDNSGAFGLLGLGQEYACKSGVRSGSLLECTPASCASTVPVGIGYSQGCDKFTTDGVCVQRCRYGYDEIQYDGTVLGGEQSYTCDGGFFLASKPLHCTPKSCNEKVLTGFGFGTSCDGLGTDLSCQHMCATGWTDNSGNSSGQAYTCNDRIFVPTNKLLTCTPDSCSSTIPTGLGYSVECQDLRADGACAHTCNKGYTDVKPYTDAENRTIVRTFANYTCTEGTLDGDLLECVADDCTLKVPVGIGFSSHCENLTTDGSCHHSCTAGYTDNNGGDGQQYSCYQAVFKGTYLQCTPNQCWSTNVTVASQSIEVVNASSPNGTNASNSVETVALFTIPSGEGYGYECDEFVTDETCHHRCKPGFTNQAVNGSNGQVYTCDAGVFVGTPLNCTRDLCDARIPVGIGFEFDGCAGLSTNENCTHKCMPGYTGDNLLHSQYYECPWGVLNEWSGGDFLTCDADDCTQSINVGAGYRTDCEELVTDTRCVHACLPGYSSATNRTDSDGTVAAGTRRTKATYTCPAGLFIGDRLVCEPDLCTDNVPDGDGFSQACSSLKTDETCFHSCGATYTDNNAGKGQTYSCHGGVFVGTPLTCKPNDCTTHVPSGPGYGEECNALVSGGYCSHRCLRGYADAQGRKEVVYSCAAGDFEIVEKVENISYLRTSTGILITDATFDKNSTTNTITFVEKTTSVDLSNVLTCVAQPCTTAFSTGIEYDEQCAGLVTDSACTQSCYSGFAPWPTFWGNHSDQSQQHAEEQVLLTPTSAELACPAGVLTGVPIKCFPQNCTAMIPTGVGYDDGCRQLVSGGSCSHRCTAGFTGNNLGQPKIYTCLNGTIAEPLLLCARTADPSTVGRDIGIGLSSAFIILLIAVLVGLYISKKKLREQNESNGVRGMSLSGPQQMASIEDFSFDHLEQELSRRRSIRASQIHFSAGQSDGLTVDMPTRPQRVTSVGSPTSPLPPIQSQFLSIQRGSVLPSLPGQIPITPVKPSTIPEGDASYSTPPPSPPPPPRASRPDNGTPRRKRSSRNASQLLLAPRPAQDSTI
jgi:hypothetical protein